jgi:hypothetical protein
MGLRDTLRKAAGLLVELPPEEPETPETPKASRPMNDAEIDARLAAVDKALSAANGAPPSTRTVEQIVRDAPGPNLEDIRVPASASPPTAAPDGKMSFASIYQHANLPPAPFTAEQMLDMLASLPPELPLETKRQTVKVTLASMGKAIGATPDTIVADASRKLAALAAYADAVAKQSAELTTAANLEIAKLQAEIEEKRKAIEKAQQIQAQVTKMCEAESDRLDDVLEFFSLDVPPSKNAPPDKGP